MSGTLGERQAAILRALVREYVRTGEPVGSKHIVDRARINASSATVRNEMARLEEQGFVAQPHTSAGRVPTDRGYRFVVDEIRPKPLAEGQRRALQEELSGDEPGSVDDLLHRASDVLARFTHHAAAVLTRHAAPATVRRIEVFPIGVNVAMCIVIAGNGRVEQRMIPLDALVTDADVEKLGDRLSRELTGNDLEAGIRSVDASARNGAGRERPLLEAIRSAMQSLVDADEQVFVGGVANLANERSFERDTLQRLYEAIEAQTAVLELLTGMQEPLTVRIGSELSNEDLHACSVVVANFEGTGDSRGSIGVIGPTRMDYERVIVSAQTVARLLGGALGSPDAPTT
jgi:heat-inducible transcriptional repressor